MYPGSAFDSKGQVIGVGSLPLADQLYPFCCLLLQTIDACWDNGLVQTFRATMPGAMQTANTYARDSKRFAVFRYSKSVGDYRKTSL